MNECVFNKTKIYKDGQFDLDTLLEGARGIWKPIVQNAIEVCVPISECGLNLFRINILMQFE